MGIDRAGELSGPLLTPPQNDLLLFGEKKKIDVLTYFLASYPDGYWNELGG